MSVLPKSKSRRLPPPVCQLPGKPILDRKPILDVKDRLEEIAAAIRAGAPAARFQKEMDRLLGTEMEERDAFAEAAWEDAYRNRGSLADG